MNARDEKTTSLWMDVEVAPDAPRLTKDERADVAVIGSGIAGLSTAYELSRRGLNVVVVDRGAIASGMTARTTAHLTANSDDYFDTLIKTRGLDGAKTFYASHSKAIDRMEAIQAEERIECNFRRLNGYLFLGPKTDKQELEAEFNATKKVGMEVRWHRGVPFNHLSDVDCLLYPNQGAFHPLRYLRGVAGAITARGGRLYANTVVSEIAEKDSTVELKIETGQKISAGRAVVATNSPTNERLKIHDKQAPYRTYVVVLTIPKGAIEDALYWDTLDPYHYVRLQPGPGGVDYLIVGGADHKTGEADDGEIRFEALEAWARGLLPNLGKVTHRWSGQVLDPVDYAAFIGLDPGHKNVFVHTGDSGQGITHGVVGSLLLADLITTGKSDWAGFYDPARQTASAVQNFISENVTAVKNFAEYVAPGELSSFEELEPGRGAIIREGLNKVAAYRDEKGKLHRLSAKCTHAGCHVHWNSAEQCWDCPCHGSHFATDGRVLNGPAISPLEKLA